MNRQREKFSLAACDGVSMVEALVGSALIGMVAYGLTIGQMSNRDLYSKVGNASSRNLTDNTLPSAMFTAIHKGILDQAEKNLDYMKQYPETSDQYRICRFTSWDGFSESLRKTVADNSLNETIEFTSSSASWLKQHFPDSACARDSTWLDQTADHTDSTSLNLCVHIKGLNAQADQWWNADAGIQEDKKLTSRFYEHNDVYMEFTYVFRDLRTSAPISCKDYVKADVPSAGTLLYTIYWWQKGRDKATTKPSYFNGEVFGRARLPLAVAVQKMYADFLDVKQGEDSVAITEKDLDKYMTALELGKSLKEVSVAIQREPVVLQKKAEMIAESTEGSTSPSSSVLAMKQAWQSAYSSGACPGAKNPDEACVFAASDVKPYSKFVGSIYAIIGDFAAETEEEVLYNGYYYSWYYWAHLNDQANLSSFLAPSGSGPSVVPSAFFRDIFDNPSHPNYLYRPGITLREFAEIRRQIFNKIVESSSFANFAVQKWKRKFDIKFSDQDSLWANELMRGTSWEDVQAQMNGSLSYAID
jgi:hypothetical protein